VLIAGAFLALFSFKDRKRQMLLTRVLMFLSVAFISAIVNSTNGMREMTDPGHIFRYGAAAVLVIIPPIMAFLALRGIKKDDALVRSADRLR
jgi:peptidoglycan/LPS O-acetylase OafA/YrhL